MPEAKPSARPRAAGVTDVGRQRKHNEDHILVKPELRLFVVADGMGGHNAGDIASKLTTTSLKNFFEATQTETVPADLLDEDAPADQAARRLIAGIQKANRDVFVISNTHQQHHGMGSTVVAAHFGEDVAHICHVGDSRAYRIRDGVIEQLTRDHSLINDAIEMKPDLTEDEIARLPKNIITRALGMKEDVKVDWRTEPILAGDIFLLCSDGLSGMIEDAQMVELVSIAAGEPQEACELLIAEANDAGGVDNISAVMVRFDAASADEIEAPEVAVSTIETGVDSAIPPAMKDILERGAEVDLELAGPWSDAPARKRTICPTCKHEVYSGNAFCVECGTRVSDD